jgi:hypothetical protein
LRRHRVELLRHRAEALLLPALWHEARLVE